MACTYFISDLHLDSERPAITRAFFRFLDDHRHADALYILGDLFETWIGDDDNGPLAIEVGEFLSRYTSTGPDLFLMQGNRDFLIAERFAHSTGAILLADPTVIDLYGRPTLLTHGDALCTADTDYQAFRRQVREPAWQAEFLERPLAERRAFAEAARNMSREALASKSEDIVDVSPAAVSALLKEFGVDQLIHGHTHRPGHHQTPESERWVLGDWNQSCCFLEASNAQNSLKKFIIYQ